MNALHLPANLARQIEREGSDAYPNECCGILIGNERGGKRTVERLEPVENTYDADERYHRFSISPQTLMRVDRQAGDEGKMVLGFYHSHPDHPARPSETDRQAAWPFYSYVIVSIAKRQAVDMTSWLLDEETNLFKRQDIEEL